MTAVIIDYGSGNLHSAAKAFERASLESGLETKIIVSADPEAVRKAERIVLPGVGAFKDCRNGIKAIPGMWEELEDQVIRKGKPFFGICVGMQLMASRGLEHEETSGFAWIAGDVKKVAPSDPSLKIPHMGWNTLDRHRPHPVLDGLPLGEQGLHAYFVHSYHLEAYDPDTVIATAPYGMDITAVIGRDNLFGTQFHPEKSQRLGLSLVANFLGWRP